MIFIKLTGVRTEGDYELMADCSENIVTLSPDKILCDL